MEPQNKTYRITTQEKETTRRTYIVEAKDKKDARKKVLADCVKCEDGEITQIDLNIVGSEKI